MAKYFFISMFGTAITIVLALQIPMVRRRVFAFLDHLADWHERGTREVEGEVKGDDPFLLARVVSRDGAEKQN